MNPQAYYRMAIIIIEQVIENFKEADNALRFTVQPTYTSIQEPCDVSIS